MGAYVCVPRQSAYFKHKDMLISGMDQVLTSIHMAWIEFQIDDNNKHVGTLRGLHHRLEDAKFDLDMFSKPN